MTFEEAKILLRAATIEGREGIGKEYIKVATPFVPVATGALRKSGRVEVNGDKVFVVYGGGDIEYAKYQHDNLLGHLGARGKYKSILNLGEPSSISGDSRSKGQSISSKYARRYKWAKEQGLLSNSRAQWLEQEPGPIFAKTFYRLVKRRLR